MANFKILAREGKARAGVLRTGHGEVKTPTFMPVGTQGSVKALSPDDLKETKSQIILGNTYHLYLRPGSKLIKKMGGLHKFMNWDGPILTDSGGFQAFSLGAGMEHRVKKIQKTMDSGSGVSGMTGMRVQNGNQLKGESAKGVENYRVDIDSNSSYIVDNCEKLSQNREKKGRAEGVFGKVTDEGVEFKSHLDGSKHLLTPEKSIEVQLDLGSDIVLVLDELLSPLHDKDYVEKSLKRTHDWEERSKKYFQKHIDSSINKKTMLFGIVQGVYNQDIREQEARWIVDKGFDGIAIGGSCGVSEYWGGQETEFWATKAIYETMGWVTPLLPASLPRHALGIGEIVDFFECVERGIDMFDCVSPTRRARNGSVYISPKNGGKEGNKFTISIGRSAYCDDPNPIDPGCGCYTCQNFSRAYLRHTYLASELLYHRLASIHNVYFFNNLLEQIRIAIYDKQFQKLKKKWLG